MKIEIICPSQVKHGDTLLINGEQETVDRKFIHYNDFMETTTIHGQVFRKHEKVRRVLFAKWHKSQILSYV